MLLPGGLSDALLTPLYVHAAASTPPNLPVLVADPFDHRDGARMTGNAGLPHLQEESAFGLNFRGLDGIRFCCGLNTR